MKALRKSALEVAVMLPTGFAIGTVLDVLRKAVGH